VRVLILVRREDDVTSGDEEEPLSIPALGNEEAAGTLSPRRRLGADGETERSGKGFAESYSRVERGSGREKLGAGQAGNDRLANLDIDIGDIVFDKNLPAPGGHDDTVIARERCGHHADPEDDGGGRFTNGPDA